MGQRLAVAHIVFAAGLIIANTLTAPVAAEPVGVAQPASVACHSAEPSKDSEGVYLVAEPKHLMWLAATTAADSLAAAYRQSANIDLSLCGDWPGIGGGVVGRNRHQQPQDYLASGLIITNTNPFTGSYNGGGFTISNVSVNASNAGWGLFRNIDGALITNLGLSGVTVSVTGVAENFFGSLAGYAHNSTVSLVTASDVTLKSANTPNSGQCANVALGGLIGAAQASSLTTSQVTGNLTGDCDVGGAIGYLSGASTITDVAFAGTVSANSHVGGAIGSVAAGGSTIHDATFSGEVSANSYVGGGVGSFVGAGTLSGIMVSGSVTATTFVVGGVIGYIPAQSESVSVTDAVVSGPVSGTDYVGGALGLVSSPTTLNRVEVNGSVSGTGSTGFVGGLTGAANTAGETTITNSSVTGAVQASTLVGGLVGYLSGVGTLSGIMVSGSVTATTSNVGGVIGYIPAQSESVSVTDAVVSGPVSGPFYVGGVLGFGLSPTTITDATVLGAVSANSYVGGVIGYLSGVGTLSGITVSGSVTATTFVVGGVIGFVPEHPATVLVTDAAVSGPVSGTDYVGGALGLVSSPTTLNRVEVKGPVSGTGSTGFVGGLTGAIGLPAVQSQMTDVLFSGTVSALVSVPVGCYIGNGIDDEDGRLFLNGSRATGTKVVGEEASPCPQHMFPTNVSATPGDGQVTVSWAAPVRTAGRAVTGYVVTGSPAGSCEVVAVGPDAAATSCVVGGLTNGTPHTFTVVASNVAGSGAASDPSDPVTPTTVPASLTDLIVTPRDGEVTIAFTAGADGGDPITNYEFSVDDGSTWTAFAPAVTASPVTISALTNGIEYVIRLRAVNAVGSGAASAAVTATPVAPTVPPVVAEVVTLPPPTTVAPPTVATVPAPVPGPSGVVTRLPAGEREVLACAPVGGNGIDTASSDGSICVVETVEVVVENEDQDLVVRSEDFELRLTGECASECRIATDVAGRQTLEFEVGGSVRVAGTGFVPGSTANVWLFSDPRFLGSVEVNLDGSFAGSLSIGQIEVGEHTVQVSGVSADGRARSVNLGIMIREPSVSEVVPELPAAGTETNDKMHAWSVLFLALGGLMWLVARRPEEDYTGR